MVILCLFTIFCVQIFFVPGTIGAAVIFVILILISGASLIIFLVHVNQARSSTCSANDTGAYETVEITNPVPVGCPMNENQAYGIARKPMLERKAPKQHSTEVTNANFSMDLNEAYETVTETVEISNPVPVGCPMSENQAYGIARKPMLEERRATKRNQHSTEVTNASMDFNEAYETVAENIYDTIKD